ncbi:MAG: glycosyltransferase family 2 protein [Proteobacteria bacterium]|nr:glycosyltransferase family 2 protein [Pseudomonadota bacterium]
MKSYFYSLLYRYISIYIRPDNTVVEINPQSSMLSRYFKNIKMLFLSKPSNNNFEGCETIPDLQALIQALPEYILLNGNIHYERDLQSFMEKLHVACNASTRLVFTYYSTLWKPLFKFATLLGLRLKTMEENWITHDDIANILILSDYETVSSESKIIVPFYVPFISNLVNRYIAPLPIFRNFCIVNILVARPIYRRENNKLSVSVVVPARNEAGNIEAIIKRLPKMGPDDELIFVEGNSIDNTWEVINNVCAKYTDKMNIKIAKQDGKGKGDAVRKGFMVASKDILMILDADMTVPPETLPMFYKGIMEGKGEFMNGSRLVYPMEKEAMRFFNIIGNKFFAVAFSFVLGQKFKDTLCGTKALTKENYKRIAANRTFFGDFDPFGDFDLIFGAARLNLKIREIPISYKERKYGTTNISRWTHGLILLQMLIYAARKIRFV